jgi:RNA 3'-terminal phosphate cyclase
MCNPDLQVIKALEDSITTELKKTYPKISLTITRTSPIPSPTCATGVTIYGQTTQGHRLSSSTLIELPTRLTPTILSKQEVKARERGAQVVRQLLKEISQGGVVDEYLADQIIIFMALATSGVAPPIAMDRGVTVDAGKKRRSEILVGQVSLHTETAMRIAEMMLGNVAFSTKNVEGSGIIIMCDKTG